MAHTEDKHHHHVIPAKFYFLNFLALLFFMALTIWASYIHFPGGTIVNNLVAILIALTKMMLVIAIFMGVKWSTRLTKLWAATGFVWFLLLFLTFGDYFTRDWEVVPSWNPDHKDHPVLGGQNLGEGELGGQQGHH
jgi:caa(3)-type oxidase subunit IV